MQNLVNSLENTLKIQQNWRIDEITSLKTIPYKKNISTESRLLLFKYSVPAFYAIWEGFIVSSIQEYINMINSLNLTIDEIHPKILTHDINCKHDIKSGRVNLNKRIELCKNLKDYFIQPTNISQRISTNNNVNFKVTNNILESFNLNEINNRNKTQYKLDQLVKYRNNIAHGENSLKVTEIEIKDFSDIIIECMDKVYDSIIDGAINELYKNKN